MIKRVLITLALLALLLPAALVWLVIYTSPGLALLASQAPRLQAFGVQIEDVSGRLAGPLRIGKLEVDHPRIHIVARDVETDLQLRGLLIQTLRLGSLHAGSIDVQLREHESEPSTEPPRFLPSYLRVDVHDIDLAQVRYTHLDGMLVDAGHVQARLTLTSNRMQLRHLAVQSEQFDVTGDVSLLATDPLGVRAQLAGAVRWQPPERDTVEVQLQADVRGSLEDLRVRAEALTPSEAQLEAAILLGDGTWNVEAQLTSPGIQFDPFIADPPVSLRDVAMTLSASAEQIHLQGSLGVPEIDSENFQIDARGTFQDRQLNLSAATLQLNNSPASLQVSGTVQLADEAPIVDMRANWQALQWPLRGDAMVSSNAGDAQVSGAMPYNFTVNAAVEGAQVPTSTGTVVGVVSREEVDVSRYELETLEGTLEGTAKVQFADQRAWSATLRARSINPGLVAAQFPGRITLSADANGRGLDADAAFVMNLRSLTGQLRGHAIQGRGWVQREGSNISVRDVRVGFADAVLQADGDWHQSINGHWTLEAPALDKLLPGADGSLRFSGAASGTRDEPQFAVDLQANRLRYQAWGLEQLTLNANINANDAAASNLTLSARRLGNSPQPLIETLELQGSGTAGEHQLVLDMISGNINPRVEPTRLQMQIDGSYQQQAWNATVARTDLTTAKFGDTIGLVEPAEMLVSAEQVKLEELCLAITRGRACLAGQWQRDQSWSGQLSGYEIPLALLLPPAGAEAEYGGRIEGSIQVNGAANRPWVGEAGMRIINAAIIYRPQGSPAETLSLGEGGLSAIATEESVDVSFGVQAFTDTFLHANAHLQRDGSNDFLNLPLTGDMRARAADANVLPLAFPDVDNAAGLLSAQADFTGTLAAPEVHGRIQLTNGELDSYQVNLALRDLNVDIQLQGNSLALEGTGRAGDGRLRMGGELAWSDGKSQGTLQLQGSDLLLADLSEYRVIASPDLQFRIDGNRMDVTGEVLIPSALIQPNQFAGAVRASADARYVHETVAETEGRMTVHSEVRVRMGEDVRIEAFGLQGRLGGAVTTLVATGETPRGRGEVGVVDGRYDAYGQQLEISKGQLQFDNSPLDNPALDIEARRKIEAITVGLNVRGTLQEPRITFFSDPAMPQTQVVTYLITGKAVSSVGGSDTATMNAARDALALQGGGLLASQVGRRLGLEEVGVESSVGADGDANTSLVLGKFLSPRLFISYGISLTESINTLKLRYTISDRWIFRTEAGEAQSADLEYTIER